MKLDARKPITLFANRVPHPSGAVGVKVFSPGQGLQRRVLLCHISLADARSVLSTLSGDVAKTCRLGMVSFHYPDGIEAHDNGLTSLSEVSRIENIDAFRDHLVEVLGEEPAPSHASAKVDHPAHYGGKNNPYEAIKVIRAWNLGFALGNAIKYIARAGKKSGESAIDDLRKARWYLDNEIESLINSVSSKDG